MTTKARRKHRGTVRDARGRRVPAVSMRALAESDGANDSRRRNLVQRLRRRTKEAAWKLAGANSLWIVIGALVLSRLEDRFIARNTFQGLPRIAAIAGVFCVIGAVLWWVASRAAWLRRSRLAVEAGFCGSCGYDIAALKPQDDGNIVCPECGSAWRRPLRAASQAEADAP